MQAPSSIDSDLQQCIDACLHCYQTCLRTAMTHCLETGGRHVEPSHFRLMHNCSEICRTAADFMLTGSAHHTQVCTVCATVCDACADSCEQIGAMDECVQACRACASRCHRVIARGKDMTLPHDIPPMPESLQDRLPM